MLVYNKYYYNGAFNLNLCRPILAVCMNHPIAKSIALSAILHANSYIFRPNQTCSALGGPATSTEEPRHQPWSPKARVGFMKAPKLPYSMQPKG